MLRRIGIRNLVIVHDVSVEFDAGMIALTGETGAGKSILIDALGLALGDKADNGLIRAGSDKAEVNVAFELPAQSTAARWLSDNDLADAGEDCLIRRVLVRDGRSRGYINGTPATQAQLRTLGEKLVDIHGQHAHQSLVRAPAQRTLLDAYAGNHKQLAEVAASWSQLKQRRSELKSLRQSTSDRINRLDYLNFQLQELEPLIEAAARLDELEAEHSRLANAERLQNESQQLLNLLTDDEHGLTAVTGQAERQLDSLCKLDPGLSAASDLLQSTAIQLDELGGMLRHYSEMIEIDPHRLQTLDDQLGRLYDAARKHHVPVSELADLYAGLDDERQQLENSDRSLVDLENEVSDLQRRYDKQASELSNTRAAAAARLSQTVTESMQSLSMKGGIFDISIRSDTEQQGAHGRDQVVFMVAANPGQPPAALGKVASGGELSRISLAIQVATAGCGEVPTLIFDEVDVGIGGAVAEIVGQLLRNLGTQRQVLCVTHLPQVASQAHQHFRVHKTSDGKITDTRIEKLDATARVDEVARMLGGVDITEQTLKHAGEMIERAQA